MKDLKQFIEFLGNNNLPKSFYDRVVAPEMERKRHQKMREDMRSKPIDPKDYVPEDDVL